MFALASPAPSMNVAEDLGLESVPTRADTSNLPVSKRIRTYTSWDTDSDSEMSTLCSNQSSRANSPIPPESINKEIDEPMDMEVDDEGFTEEIELKISKHKCE